MPIPVRGAGPVLGAISAMPIKSVIAADGPIVSMEIPVRGVIAADIPTMGV